MQKTGLGVINRFIAVLLLCMLFVSCNGQQKKSSAQVVDEFASELAKEKQADSSKITDTEASAIDYKTDSLRFAKELNMYEFSAWHRKLSFTWQLYSGIIIFIMVLGIVISGLVLSFRQFKLTELQVKNRLEKNSDQLIPADNTSLEFSETGIKINTAVIGLCILFFSLGFFFLYLKYIYKIEVLIG